MYKLFIFTLLTGWIAFVSITSNIFYGLDTIEQSELVKDCYEKVSQVMGDAGDKLNHHYIESTGGYHVVKLDTLYRGFREPYALCFFDREGNFRSAFGDNQFGKDFSIK